ncbi:MAG: hypothetical protein RSP_18230 [Rhodanobacter sp.]
MGKTQLTPDQTLKAVVEAWANAKAQWPAPKGPVDWRQVLPDVDGRYRKSKDLDPWGVRVQDALMRLEPDRCNQLSFDELAALQRTGSRNLERHVKEYLVQEQEGDGPRKGGYHLFDVTLGTYRKWHYHRTPFLNFMDRKGDQTHERKVEAGRRNARAPVEAELLKADSSLAKRFKELAADLESHGFAVSLRHFPAFASLLDAQTHELSRAVTEPQPWLTNAKGHVVDHAGWPIATAGAIRTLLEKGGAVESMPLMTALKRDWKPGTPLMLWTAVVELAMERWREDHQKRLPSARAHEALEKKPRKVLSDRKRS